MSLGSHLDEGSNRDLVWLTAAHENMRGYQIDLIRAAHKRDTKALTWSTLRLTSIYKYFSDDLPTLKTRPEILNLVHDIEQLSTKPAFNMSSFSLDQIGDLDL